MINQRLEKPACLPSLLSSCGFSLHTNLRISPRHPNLQISIALLELLPDASVLRKARRGLPPSLMTWVHPVTSFFSIQRLSGCWLGMKRVTISGKSMRVFLSGWTLIGTV